MEYIRLLVGKWQTQTFELAQTNQTRRPARHRKMSHLIIRHYYSLHNEWHLMIFKATILQTFTLFLIVTGEGRPRHVMFRVKSLRLSAYQEPSTQHQSYRPSIKQKCHQVGKLLNLYSSLMEIYSIDDPTVSEKKYTCFRMGLSVSRLPRPSRNQLTTSH